MSHQAPDSGLRRAADLIRDVPDYPSPGVLFRDLTPVLADPEAYRAVLAGMAERIRDADVVVAVEARGFLIGSAVAAAVGLGVVPVRKAGKLPAVAASRSYQLEYGTATLELPADVMRAGDRVYLVDDVLATGGTLEAAADLVERAGGLVSGIGVVLELSALGGRERLARSGLHALLEL
jgi:adenine phosphoribosyltransferase